MPTTSNPSNDNIIAVARDEPPAGSNTNLEDIVVDAHQNSVFSKGVPIARGGLCYPFSFANIPEYPSELESEETVYQSAGAVFIRGIQMAHVESTISDDPENHWIIDGDDLESSTPLTYVADHDKWDGC